MAEDETPAEAEEKAKPANPPGSPLKTGRKAAKKRTSARVRAGNTAQAVSSTGQAATAAVPGTDAVGGIFKLLSLVGVAGLLVFHPDTFTGVFQNGIKTVRTIIAGK